MKTFCIKVRLLKPVIAGAMMLVSLGLSAQTNVFDDVIAVSPDHTSLRAALEQEGLDAALQNPAGTFTVFAPDNAAFDALATALNTDIPGLLALPNLSDILLYHVLGTTVQSSGVTNGSIVTPLNADNTLKLTVDGTSVYVNQAQVNAVDLTTDNGVVHSIDAVVLPNSTVADIAIGSPAHTTLVAAVVEARLLPALTNPFAELTVFAPTNDAFADALTALGLTAPQLLASPDLEDILLYHVLGSEVLSTDLSNGLIANPLNTSNTLKVTIDGTSVYVNQAQVSTADLMADNGAVHVLDAVVLPVETVADVAIGSPAHTTLVAAVVEARLLPALTNPFAELTVFAPTDDAFADALTALGLTAPQLLASPDLADILLYHVLGSEVLSTDLSNGLIANPLNTANTLKVTIDGTSVYVNQAQVSTADLMADNGAVHVLDAVVLPVETVADIAIGSPAHTTLVAAVVEARLLPALTNPFAELTVFAPTDDAFDTLADDLETDLNGLLALPNLADILLYHVIGSTVMSTDLVEGPVATLNGANVIVSLDGGVMINESNVTLADLEADNGVVHVIDAVLLEPSTASITEYEMNNAVIYPNPAVEYIRFSNIEDGTYSVVNMMGAKVMEGNYSSNGISIIELENGTYMIQVSTEAEIYQGRFVKY